MKEELTTDMHLEFCKDEEDRLDTAACAVYMAVLKHKQDFKESLAKYNITEKQYEKYKP